MRVIFLNPVPDGNVVPLDKTRHLSDALLNDNPEKYRYKP
jgi:hypothetical protein